jgi:ATP-dependent Lon protease
MVRISHFETRVLNPAKPLVLPLIRTEMVVLFPGEIISLELTRADQSAISSAYATKDRLIAIVFSHGRDRRHAEPALGQVGTVARLITCEPNGNETVAVAGIGRIIVKKIRKENSRQIAEAEFIDDMPFKTHKTSSVVEQVLRLVDRIVRLNKGYPAGLVRSLGRYRKNPGQLADKIASSFLFPLVFRQVILESLEVEVRLGRTLSLLEDELRRYEIAAVAPDGHLAGDSIRLDDVENLKSKLVQNKNLPRDARERCLIEIDRLSQLSSVSAEYGTTRQYIDWILSIPWGVYSGEDYDLKHVETDINKGYYGPGHIRKRILERIAVRKLSGGVADGPVLCLAGVPGTGKASLARAIAGALKKKFLRIPLGGITDVADIKGVARTSLGAMPGNIIRLLVEAGASDPVVLVEDIDSFAEESSAALLMSLAEAIDPRYNHRFLDNYIGLHVDLAHVFFICAVRTAEDIPEILNHRMELIELPGYIEKEKIHIARKYLMPAVLKKHGLKRKDLKITENGLKKIIRNYTLEAGLLNFKRQIERICRHVAKEKAARADRAKVFDERAVENFLGSPQFIPEKPGKSPEIGVAIGLAWTGLGGDLMTIEAIKMKGTGEVITTGSLGEVMKESIQAANSYVRSKADILGIDHTDFENFNVHIHFPSGAIPKDGPSAGIAVCLVIASVMSERPIPNDIAMTGEVTLRGKVLQVGGIIEKISAAYRAGIRKVFIPKENKKDLKDLPADILKRTRFIFVDCVDDVFAQGLLNFTPSSFTLEKLFAREMEKAKTRKKSNGHKKKIAAKGSSRRHTSPK